MEPKSPRPPQSKTTPEPIHRFVALVWAETAMPDFRNPDNLLISTSSEIVMISSATKHGLCDKIKTALSPISPPSPTCQNKSNS